MIMHKNAPIIMASVIAAILTASVLAFALPNQAFGQVIVFKQAGIPLALSAAAPSFAANAAGLALSAAGGAAPSFAANLPGLGLSATPGAAGINFQGVPLTGLRAGSGTPDMLITELSPRR